MTLIPGGHLLENMKFIWVNGVGANSAPFWLMMLNSFIMAFGITVGKITVSMLSAFAIVWFRFPLRNLFFWMIFIVVHQESRWELSWISAVHLSRPTHWLESPN